jgi:hypothetical protein
MKKAIFKALARAIASVVTTAGSSNQANELPGLEALDIVPPFKTPRGTAHVARRPPA